MLGDRLKEFAQFMDFGVRALAKKTSEIMNQVFSYFQVSKDIKELNSEI